MSDRRKKWRIIPAAKAYPYHVQCHVMKLFDAVATSWSDYIPGNGIVNVKMNVKGFISSRSFYSSQWKRIPCHWVAVVLLFFLRLRLCSLTGTGLSSASRTRMRLDITKWESSLRSLRPANDSLKTANFECSTERRKRVSTLALLRGFDCTQQYLDDSEGLFSFTLEAASF